MQSTYLIFTGFDLETRPLPDLVERFGKPFPDFDESAVKCGNLKDPVKKAEKIAQARVDHEADGIAYWQNLRDRAALNPFTAQIVVIGLIDQDGETAYLEGNEAAILAGFWAAFTLGGEAARKFVFWSGNGGGGMNTEKEDGKPRGPASLDNFDLDFIVTRSRILGVRVPPQVRNGRFYAPRFVDLSKEFLLHRRGAFLSVTKAAEIFGLYGDNGTGPDGVPADRTIFPKRDDDPVTGENFWRWYDGTATETTSKDEQRLFALRYLGNDLRHLLHLAPRIL